MAGFDDITKKAQDLVNDGRVKAQGLVADGKERVTEAAKSDKAEEISDKVLDGVAGFADKITGGRFHDKIESTRDDLDKKIGPDGVDEV